LFEVPVALVVVSSYLAVDPVVFVDLATPAAAASLLWLGGGLLADAVEERVNTAVAAGRAHRAKALALALAPAVPMLGPGTGTEICQLIATVLWRTGSAGWAVWWQRRVAGVRRCQRETRHQLNALINVAMFQHTASRYTAAMRTLREATEVVRKLPGYLAKVERLAPESINAEVAAYTAEIAVVAVHVSRDTGDISRAVADAGHALAALGGEDPAWPQGAPSGSDVLRRLQTSYRDLALTEADLTGSYLYDEKRAEQLYQGLEEVAGRFDDALADQTLQGVGIRLSALMARQGRYAEAEAKLRAIRSDGDSDTHAFVVANLANVARQQAHYEEAEQLYREVLPALSGQPHLGLSAGVLTGLSDVLAARGAFAEALEMGATAARQAEQIGSEMMIRASTLNLGRICEKAGSEEAALGHYRRVADVLESTRGGLAGDEHRIGYVGHERRLEAYERLVAAHLRLGDVSEAYRYAERGKARALLDRLGEAEPPGDSKWRKPLGHEQVQECLAEAGRPLVVVEYFVGDGRLVVFGLRADTGIEARTLPVDLVEVRRFAQANFGTAGRVRDMTLSGLDELWHGFDVLVEPLAAWSRRGDVIVFVPHGILHYLPLHALRVDGDYVIARNPVSYAPSASVLAHSRRAQALAEGRAAVFGDPRDDLAYARTEAVSLAGLLKTQAVLGADATPEAFARGAAGAAFVHYAGHASFDTGSAAESALLLAGGQLLSARQIQDLPGLRPRVVTLSGCETGISRRHPGDELTGLTRSFLYAGAATVVASLWRVADESTTELMRIFYGHLVDGTPSVDALRRAMLAVAARPDWSALYHWAPFILVGDWE
jgi:tetratricopeptide (TPR) repeat protein